MVFPNWFEDRLMEIQSLKSKDQILVRNSPEKTFQIGEDLGEDLKRGDVVLLSGGLGAGKTLFTKGVLNALNFDIDEVTSPSFTLVNLYRTDLFDVYHIDLWRIEGSGDARFAVGLDDILENEEAVLIIEWADRLGKFEPERNVIRVMIRGDGDEDREVTIT